MSDVFNESPAPAAEDPVVVKVDDLVGPDKKFKTADDLAKGKTEADKFIARLEKEMADLRADLNTKVDAEKQLSDLREELRQLRANPSPQPKDNTNPSLTAEDIQAVVQATITRAEQNKTVAQNIRDSNDSVVRHYGDLTKASEAVKAKAAELGVSIDYLKNIAATSPTAFRKIVIGEAKSVVADPTVTHSTVNPATIPTGGNPAHGTKEYYDNLRKTSPKEYWKPSTQQAIIKAVEAGTYVP